MLIHVKDFVQNNSDYSTENRITSKIVLFYKDMASWKFSTIWEKQITRQQRNNNLYFLINFYLGISRKEEDLRIIYALWFDIDNEKDKIPEDRMWESIKNIEIHYWLIPHIINKTMWGFHIFYLFEGTPYWNFNNEFERLYIFLRDKLEADKGFSRKAWILKVVWSYDFRKYWTIINIKNENHNRYKLTDCRKILWDEIFEKYNTVNFEDEFEKIEEENKIFIENEKIAERKKNFFIYKINNIDFLIILKKLKNFWYDFRLNNDNKVEYYIDNTLIDTFQISYYEAQWRAIDWTRDKRKENWKKSRWANYWFLYFVFGELENRVDEKKSIKDKETTKELIRKFIWKYFWIYRQLDPENYINTNKLIFDEFISSPLEFDSGNTNFLLENDIINEEWFLTSTSLFILLSILKMTEMNEKWTVENKTIYELLYFSHLKYQNINKQRETYKMLLLWLSMLYRNLDIKWKESNKTKVHLIWGLNIDNDLISFILLKNYFKLDRDEKNYYRWIPIEFIKDEKINISRIYFYIFLLQKFLEIKNPKINKNSDSLKIKEKNTIKDEIVKVEITKEINIDDCLYTRWNNWYLVNKSKYKKITIEEIYYFKKLLPNDIKINITKDNFVQIIKTFEKKL